MNRTDPEIISLSIDFAKNRMKKYHSSHGWDHVERVMQMAEIISETGKDSDSFIIHVSSILHDIAREDENVVNGKVCHAELGSLIAGDFLTESGLEESRVKHITDCILSHRFRNNSPPETIEAKILYDADKLDSIGAIGIGRAFLFSGEIGARLHNNSINIHKTKSYSKEDSAYREYVFKLRNIKDKMFTECGSKMAESRHNFMVSFFDRLKDEINGEY